MFDFYLSLANIKLALTWVNASGLITLVIFKLSLKNYKILIFIMKARVGVYQSLLVSD